MEIVIDVKNLNVKFGDVHILKNVSFKVKKGEFIGIIGPNGAGKTTLIKALLGFIPYDGSIYFYGKVGYVPQLSSFNREFPISVYDFVRLPIRNKKDWKKEVAELLEKIGLPGFGNKLISTLSGGEYQRVSLARALVMQPDILILDEPESGVDDMGKARFYELLNEVREQKNITILMVSHDIGMIFEKCTSVMCLNKTLHCHGPTSEVDIAQVKRLFGEFDIWIRSDYHFEREHKEQQ
ncbi:MAG: metal ABC transporter ATP-binding protein [Fervidobacterium sp.]|jgi:zinc transport system ATP-binding protein